MDKVYEKDASAPCSSRTMKAECLDENCWIVSEGSPGGANV